MNFLGMGMPELVVIFLVAFLVLGPSKSIDMARTTGKVLGDLRRTFNDVIAATALDPEDLNVADPKATGPKTTGPKTTGPKTTGPNDSRSAPAKSGSQPKDFPEDSSEDPPDGTAGDSSADPPVDFHGAGRQ